MKEAIIVGIGGFLGANARYFLGGWIAGRLGGQFPYATFIINITGSFMLGLVMGSVEVGSAGPMLRLAFAVGFLGAYTTFSTFTYETFRLVESGNAVAAAMNMFTSVVVGMAAVIAGLLISRALA